MAPDLVHVLISCPETLRKNLLLEVTHKATGIHQMIAGISSSLVPMIPWRFCRIFMEHLYIALSINLGYTFYFSFENKD